MRFFEEIAAREDRNLYEIVLYPEGLFYKAYERSAFACVSRVSPFKPSKKYIKYCARDMVSVGFPAAVLSKYFPSAPRPLADGRVVIALTDRIDPAASGIWKASLPLKERQPRGSVRRAGYVLPAVSGAPGGFAAGAERVLPGMPGIAAAGAPNIRGGLRTQGPAAALAGADGVLPDISGSSAADGENVRPSMPEISAADVPGTRPERGVLGLGAERAGLRLGADRKLSGMRTEKELPGLRTAREIPNARAERVMRLIREFRLEAATPVECVLFVADLKKEINGYL